MNPSAAEGCSLLPVDEGTLGAAFEVAAEDPDSGAGEGAAALCPLYPPLNPPCP